MERNPQKKSRIQLGLEPRTFWLLARLFCEFLSLSKVLHLLSATNVCIYYVRTHIWPKLWNSWVPESYCWITTLLEWISELETYTSANQHHHREVVNNNYKVYRRTHIIEIIHALSFCWDCGVVLTLCTQCGMLANSCGYGNPSYCDCISLVKVKQLVSH